MISIISKRRILITHIIVVGLICDCWQLPVRIARFSLSWVVWRDCVRIYKLKGNREETNDFSPVVNTWFDERAACPTSFGRHQRMHIQMSANQPHSQRTTCLTDCQFETGRTERNRTNPFAEVNNAQMSQSNNNLYLSNSWSWSEKAKKQLCNVYVRAMSMTRARANVHRGKRIVDAAKIGVYIKHRYALIIKIWWHSGISH